MAVVRTFHERRVDGVLLAPSRQHGKAAQYLCESKLPCVLIDRLADDQFDQIGVDNAQAMRLLIDHVTAMGHQRIGLIAGQTGLATTMERVAAFRSALTEHGLGPGHVAPANDDTAAATDATIAMLTLAEPPTVLVSGNNMATIGAVRAIRHLGLTIPHDISLVGFDDFEWSDCFEPRLTLVAQPCAEIGRQAAERLSQRLAMPDAKVMTTRLAAKLKIRNSCARV